MDEKIKERSLLNLDLKLKEHYPKKGQINNIKGRLRLKFTKRDLIK